MAGRQKVTDERISVAVEKYLGKPTAVQIGPVSVDDIYKLLDPNTQKRTRKQMIYKFLQKKGLLPDGVSSEYDQQPTSSQSSSSEDVQEGGSGSSMDKNENQNRPPQPGTPGKEKGDSREGSRRTIKRRKVFDPSDYPTRPSKLPRKPDEGNTHLVCKVCNEDLSLLPPDTKPREPQTCQGCGKWSVHGACVWENQPWRCDECRNSSNCKACSQKLLIRGEPTVVCNLCKEKFHQKCANIPKNKVSADWYCDFCKGAFSQPRGEEAFKILSGVSVDEAEPIRAPPKMKNRKPSTIKKEVEPKEVKEDDDDEEEIPDCSEWTTEQVHSYFQMFVPSQDAQAFLDQEIDGRSLQLLQRSDVISNFNLKLGAALKVYAQVKRLQTRSRDIQLCWP